MQCDVATLNEQLSQMLEVVNVSGMTFTEPEGLGSHMVLCSDLPKELGVEAITSYSLEDAAKWSFYFSTKNGMRWDVEIRDAQPSK